MVKLASGQGKYSGRDRDTDTGQRGIRERDGTGQDRAVGQML